MDINNLNPSIRNYNNSQLPADKLVCERLAEEICMTLGEVENKIWHSHPVWFLDGNPIVGYSKQQRGVRLMFWSGADFEEDKLDVKGAKFKDASIFFNHVNEINPEDIRRWLEKAKIIQWDYKNIVKRKGVLERINSA